MNRQDKVKLTETRLVLPTQVYQEDPQPDIFQKIRRWTISYPYPRNDRIEERVRRRTWRALVIENAYLRVTVLPELGGHLYSAFDKINGREVFHRLSEIRVRPLGRRGAWAPLGVEFNFPSAHSPTTLSEVDAVLRANPDGSASIVVSDLERVSRMWYSIDITLRPGVNAVDASVTLHNRTDEPHTYYYWANAAIPVDDGLRYILPLVSTRGHGLPGSGQAWPIRGGVDYSWHRNIRHTIGAFGHGCREDFFGAYNVDKDWGVVHVADYRELPGKKLFTWGTGPQGRRKSREFSSFGGAYAEIQAGIFESQPSYDPLAPHSTVAFTESWLPLWGMKEPFSRATREAAVSLHRTAPDRLNLAVNVTRRRPGCRVVLRHRDRVVFRTTRLIAPERPFRTEVVLREGRLDEQALELTVESPEDGVLIRHRPPAQDVDLRKHRSWLDEPFHPAEASNGAAAPDGSIERLYLRGLRLEYMGLTYDARRMFEKALERDPGLARARLQLGRLCLRSGEWRKAVDHLKRALARDRNQLEVHYELGRAWAALGDDVSAADAFWVALRSDVGDARCLVELGRAAMRLGSPDEALTFFTQASSLNADDTRAVGLLSIALRRLGRAQQALDTITPLLERFPGSHLLRREELLLARVLKRPALVRRATRDFNRLMRRNVDAFIELALEYVGAGLLEDALALLRRGITATRAPGGLHAMLHYYAGWVLEKLDRPAEAKQVFARAARLAPEFCFPGRVEAIAPLERGLALNRDDATAAVALGTLLYERTRRHEAAALWRRAHRRRPTDRVLLSNLALAAWESDDPAKTAFYLRKARRLDPDNISLIVWLDSVLAEAHQDKRRMRLLTRTFREHPDSDELREHLASLLLDIGRPEEALELIARHEFRTRHGIFTLTALHMNAHIALGERRLGKRDYAGALAEFQQATTIPIQLGEDETRLRFFGKAHYLAGYCLEKLGRKSQAHLCYRRCVGERRHWMPELDYYDHLSYMKLGKPKAARTSLKHLREHLERLEARPNVRSAYVHHLRSLYLRGVGRRTHADHEAGLARRHGWRRSDELQLKYAFGFS